MRNKEKNNLFQLQGIDAKDIAILRALDMNVRASFAEIGKQARLSKEVVQYRLKQLEEKKIITGYWAQFRLPQGTTIYKVLLKNKSLSTLKKKEFIEFVLKKKMVSWFANTEGNFDYLLTCLVTDDSKFASFLDELFSLFGAYFQERHILKATTAFITNDKYLYPENEFKYSHQINVYDYARDLDEKDLIIQKEISLNSRAKYTEISQKAGITAEAVAQRYRKLSEKLNIQYKVRIDVSKLGLSYYHFFIRLQNPDAKKDLMLFYKAHSHCNAGMIHLGSYDLHLEIMCPSSEISGFLEEFSGRFGSHVASYELLHIREEYTLHIIR